MTIEKWIVPFEPSHVAGVTIHPKQRHYQHLADTPALIPSHSWSAFDGGNLIALGGYIEPSEDGRAAWLLFTDKVRPRHFFRVVRALKDMLAERSECDPPLYIDADPTYPEAGRLARLLGFSATRRVSFPDGRTMTRMIANV